MILSLLMLASCTGRPDFTPVGRATVTLDAGWSARPWETPGSSVKVLELSTKLTLPAALAGGGSELRLDGAWWSILATTNGETSAGTGGIAPTWIDLGDALRPGENTLSLRITPPAPNASSLMTAGSLTSAARAPQGAQLQAAPTLILQPAVHVSFAEVGATAEGLRPRALVEGAPEGATVRFRAVLDGALLADLGSAPVTAGTAQAPLQPWSKKPWGIGGGALFWLTAELTDTSGVVLDRWAGRTGARTAAAGESGLVIGGQSSVLMGARMVNQEDTASFRERLAWYASAGVNALEIHGEQLRPDWLSATDELGVPVVVVPRCIGRAGRNRQGAQGALGALYTEQDARMRRALAEHPSVVMLAVEGPTGGARLHSDAILTGDVAGGDRLPVAGSEPRVTFDFPARVLHIASGDRLENLQTSCMPRRCERSWVVEITPYWSRSRGHAPSPQTQWSLCAAAFASHLELGSPGGIIPTPNQRDQAGWSESWSAVAASADVPQLTGDGRGPSGLRVTGLQPGELVWLDAPLLTVVGAVADSSGTAILSLWHEGEATVRAGQRSAPVTLDAGEWEDFAWKPHFAAVDLSPR
jgi:hypothetical protein